MIYERPDFRPAGDCHLVTYFGDEMNIELNFLAHGLARTIRERRLEGVIETVPHFASLTVHYDPDRMSVADLQTEMLGMFEEIRRRGGVDLESRIVYLPVLYFDPWTKQCVEDYCRKIKPKEMDGDLLIRLNGFRTEREFIELHSATEYWVATVGFRPGLPTSLPLDPRCRLKSPKYDPPRTWTPRGALGMGGAALGLYPTPSVGGYQIFARTPLPLWDIRRSDGFFKENACLLRAGDRLRLIPIDLDEFKDIERRVEEGSYVFNIFTYQKFSVAGYNAWIDALEPKQRRSVAGG